jgi:hypothetical protein
MRLPGSSTILPHLLSAFLRPGGNPALLTMCDNSVQGEVGRRQPKDLPDWLDGTVRGKMMDPHSAQVGTDCIAILWL